MIDRPPVDRFERAKLLVADISDRVEPVQDLDGYAPMHSLYCIQVDHWGLRVLGGLLHSDLVAKQMSAHSVKMSGGRLRATTTQYLKVLRVPDPTTIAKPVANVLATAFDSHDRSGADRAARFGLLPTPVTAREAQ